MSVAGTVAVSQLPPFGRARLAVECMGSACQGASGWPGTAAGRTCSTAEVQPVA